MNLPATTRAQMTVAAALNWAASLWRRVWPAGGSVAALPAPGEIRSLAPYHVLAISDRNQPTWTDWTLETQLEKAQLGSWVGTCISKNATALAQAPWHVSTRTRGGKWQRSELHPALDLIEKPNHLWAWEDLVERVAMQLQAAGNSIVTKIRRQTGDKKPFELWTLGPHNIEVIASSTKVIAGYRYTGSDGRWHVFSFDDTVHLMRQNLLNERWGFSPMLRAGPAVDIDDEARKTQKAALQNGGVPRTIITPKTPDGRPVPKEKAKELKAEFKEEYLGAENAGKPLWGNIGLDVHTLSHTAREMEFLKGRRATRLEICAIFGVPLPIAGDLIDANYSTARTMRKHWWDDTLIPLLRLIRRGFNRQLASEWGRDVRFDFDTSDIPAISMTVPEMIESAHGLMEMGYSADEASQAVGLHKLGLPLIDNRSRSEGAEQRRAQLRRVA